MGYALSIKFGLAFLLLSLLSNCPPRSANLNIDPAIGTTIRTQGFGNADPSGAGSCKDDLKLSASNPTVIRFPRIVNLYWGSYYQKDNPGYAKRYWTDDRADLVINSDRFWAPLKEYSVPGQNITGPSSGLGYGGFGANVALSSGNLTRVALETELGNEIDNFTKGAVSPTFNGFNPWLQNQPSLDNTIFIIWLPPNITTDDLAGNFGYHYVFTHNDLDGKSHNVPYGVIGFADSWKGYDDSMFITETHEIYEAVTDPLLTNGWRDSNGNENGDLCSRAALDTAAVTIWDTGAGGTISVQKQWSVKKCDCVDINVYGAELTATPIVPGGGSGGGPPCGVPGKPKCNFPALMEQHPRQ
jgi:hypothetical protein